MSNVIERKIVQMAFDVSEFKKGILSSIEDLGRLDKALKLQNAKTGMTELEKGSKIKFDPVADSLSKINEKLSATGVAAAAFVANVTNSVISGVKSLANVLVLDPIKTGLEEYETQLNAVQTILANTARDGTTLGQVTDALDDLNLYADKTIYNFTQMTDSIGKFTTAGINLDDSVASIKGIANIAALSGSNAQQASTAMYQLSQAMAAGVIKLMDWNSVVNAGMGGQVFQDALVETAMLYDKTTERMIKKAGGFRNSLQEGWLTAEIMLQTLSKFTGDMSAETLSAMGYTQEQVESIMKTAELANDAATKIKTLTQLQDTMKEALQSGWSETWRTVFGDFEQAKALWGEVGDLFGNVISQSAQARNRMLGVWAVMGGRDDAVEGVMNVLKALVNIIDAVKQAFGDVFEPIRAWQLVNLSESFLKFSEVLLHMSENLGPLKVIVRGVASVLDILRMAALALLNPLFALVSTLLGGTAGGFVEFAAGIGNALFAFRNFAKETGFFNTLVAAAISLIKALGRDAIDLAQYLSSLDIVQRIVVWFKDLQKVDLTPIFNALSTVVGAVAIGVFLLSQEAEKLYQRFVDLQIVERVVGFFKSIDFSKISSEFYKIADDLKRMIEAAKNSETLEKLKTLFATFDGRRFSEFLSEARKNLSYVSTLIEKVSKKMREFSINTESASKNTSELGTKLVEGLNSFIDQLIVAAGKIDYSLIFSALNTGLLGALVLAVKNISSGSWLSNALEAVFGDNLEDIVESITNLFGGLEGTLKTFQNNIKSETLKNIAISLALLAGSIALLSLLDTSRVLGAATAISIMSAVLFGSSGVLGKLNSGSMTKAAVGISAMSVALLILGVSLAALSNLDPIKINTTLGALIPTLAALVLALRVVSSGQSTASAGKTIVLLLGIVLALKGLTSVVERFAKLKPNELSQGIKGIAASMAILTTSIVALGRFGGGSSIDKAVIALNGTVLALHLLAGVIEEYGTMDVDKVSKALDIIGKALLGFAAFSLIVKPSGLIKASVAMGIMSIALMGIQKALAMYEGMDLSSTIISLGIIAVGLTILAVAANAMTGALAGAAATVVMTVALLGLAAAMNLFALMDLEGVGIALLAIAGVFGILGLAGLILAPIVPVLLGLAAAMLAMGIGAVLMGTALIVATNGLLLLAASSAAVAAAIAVIGTAVISILPQLGAAIAGAMTNFLETIASNAPRIIEAMKTIIVGMVKTVAEAIPEIVEVLMDMLNAMLKAIAERLPDLIASGYEILLAFLKGIADNVQDIVATGLMIITEVINGIAKGLPDLVDSAFNLILTFMKAIEDAVNQYLPQIIQAGLGIGKALVKGIIDGIAASFSGLMESVKNLARSAVAAFNDIVGIESPSKVMYEAAVYLVRGLVNGITDHTDDLTNAMVRLGLAAQNGIDPLVNSIGSALDNTINFEPTIRPVLDLTGLTGETAELNKLFRGRSVLANLETNERLSSYDPGVNKNQQGSGTTFIQYNYSPKALDRATIYRQTNSQIAKLALRS